MPFACRLCPQTPTHILTLLPDLPHPCGFALSILVLNPKPGFGTRGSVRTRYPGFLSLEDNPPGPYYLFLLRPPSVQCFNCPSFKHSQMIFPLPWMPAAWIFYLLKGQALCSRKSPPAPSKGPTERNSVGFYTTLQ